MRIIDISRAEFREVPARTLPSEVLGGAESWLVLQEHELDYLMVEACPALLPLGFTRDGLATACAWLLKSVPNPDVAKSVAGKRILGLVARYWGRYLVDNFEGEWVMTYAKDDQEPAVKPYVLLPYGASIYPPFRDVLQCVIVRRDTLSEMAGHIERKYTEWSCPR